MERNLISSKILLVEDEPLSRQALERILRSRGFGVITASTAEEAISITKSSDVSLVLMDIELGRDPDGIEAARLIKQHDSQKPVIFISAYAGDRNYYERIKALGLSMAGFIEKPVRFNDTLLPLIDEAINHYKSTQQEPILEEPTLTSNNPDVTGQADILAPAGSSKIYQLNHVDLALYAQLQAQPELMKSLDWRVLEKLLTDILETFGYIVDLTRPTKDGGIDIIAFGKPEPWGKHCYLLQAKRWSNRVGVEPVRELMFLQNDLHATMACLATTSAFTKGAWEIHNKYRWQLDLRDYDGLKEWVEKAFTIKQRRLV